MKKYVLKMAAFLSISASLCAEPTHIVTLRPDAPIGPISPYIYGSNHEVDGFTFHDARRLGGNRLTAYNWELDASNAGRDYRNQNDRWLTKQTWWRPIADASAYETDDESRFIPAGTVHRFHEESLTRGAYSLITVPMAGYVAGDADGPVAPEAAAPSPRWHATQPAAQGQASGAEKTVYADEFVQHLVKTYGSADSERGIAGYSLDNEPALWAKTHALIHPKHVTCEELLEKSIATAAAIKSVDPKAETYGPALWGMTAYTSLSKAEDWKSLERSGDYAWFIDAYLDEMSKASKEAGVRLLDVLDVHWYTEDPKGRDATGDDAANAARALYDDSYSDPSWVGLHFNDYLPLLPKICESIDKFYPETKIAISEYDWPMTGQIYGGLAQADALGAFGKHGVYFAAYHHKVAHKKDEYVGAAFALYRNFDGKGGRFGDVAIPSQIDGGQDVVTYASIDENGRLHLILINRADSSAEVRIHVEGSSGTSIGEAWFLNTDSSKVRRHTIKASGNGGATDLSIGPYSAWHVVLLTK